MFHFAPNQRTSGQRSQPSQDCKNPECPSNHNV